MCVWARRCGKTITALEWLRRRACLIPNSVHWYIAPTYKQAKRIAWRTAKKIFTPGILRARPMETELKFTLRNGSIIMLMGAEDHDSLRGDGLTSAVLDEFGTMKREAWELGIQPALSDKDGHALFIGTPNALRGPHFQELWLRATHGKLKDQGWRTWQRRALDAPHVDPRKIWQAMRELRPWQFRQEYEASWESLSGRVWPEFKDESFEKGGHIVHAAPKAKQLRLPVGWEVVGGIDWGWVHPMAVVWLGVGPQGQVLVLAELVAQSMRLADAARHIRTISEHYGGVGNVQFYADPSRPGYIDDFTTVYGIPTVAAENSRELGIDRVGRLFSSRRLLVGGCCDSLIKSVLDYSYDPRATVPKVIRENDDECDALRYGVMGVYPPDDEEAEGYTLGDWEEDTTFVSNWRANHEEEQAWRGEILRSRE
jgi:hypothetical protein